MWKQCSEGLTAPACLGNIASGTWAFAQAANAGITVWLLFSQSLSTFVLLRSVVSAGVTIVAVVASALWFKRSMGRNGIIVHLPGWRRTAAVASGS